MVSPEELETGAKSKSGKAKALKEDAGKLEEQGLPIMAKGKLQEAQDLRDSGLRVVMSQQIFNSNAQRLRLVLLSNVTFVKSDKSVCLNRGLLIPSKTPCLCGKTFMNFILSDRMVYSLQMALCHIMTCVARCQGGFASPYTLCWHIIQISVSLSSL